MSRKRKDPAEGPDQLGTLPPDTLCLSLFSKFPYMPSRVLSRRQALAQTALKGEVDKLVAGTLKGCCVLFFGAAKTVAVIAATDIEPYLVHGTTLYRNWIRESSVLKQRAEFWPAFTDQMMTDWDLAFDQADDFAYNKSVRMVPKMCRENMEYTDPTLGSPGTLLSGTIVWTCLDVESDFPIWPAYICSLTRTQRRKYHDVYSSGDSTEPLWFINDPDSTEPCFTSMDTFLSFSKDECWIAHMRTRSHMEIEKKAKEMLRKGEAWKRPRKSDWKQWEKACKDAFALCTPIEESSSG